MSAAEILPETEPPSEPMLSVGVGVLLSFFDEEDLGLARECVGLIFEAMRDAADEAGRTPQGRTAAIDRAIARLEMLRARG